MSFLGQLVENDFDSLIVMAYVKVDLDTAVSQGLLRYLAVRLCYLEAARLSCRVEDGLWNDRLELFGTFLQSDLKQAPRNLAIDVLIRF